MADDKKPKRRLRPPQTVRERAEASAKEPQKPKKTGRIRKIAAWPFKKIAWPFKRAGKFLGRYKVFRFIGRIFRFLAKILLITYVASSWKELKLVTWPSGKESRRLTFAVLAFAVVFGAFIASLDYGLSHLFKAIILSKSQ